jgi:multidrug transporter EmrE-like cation transporter
MRAAASLPFVFLPLIWAGRLSDLKPSRLGFHLLRAGLGVVMLITFVYALRHAPLASVYSVYMAAPLLVAALAAWWLAEKVDAGRWLAIVIGFVGVLVILQLRLRRTDGSGARPNRDLEQHGVHLPRRRTADRRDARRGRMGRHSQHRLGATCSRRRPRLGGPALHH